jgi:GTP-binding protein
MNKTNEIILQEPGNLMSLVKNQDLNKKDKNKRSKTAVGSKLFKDSNLEFFGSFFDFKSIKQSDKLNPDKNLKEKISEIAFFGRSNVGKSSLLNALSFNQKLAFTSKKPGCTRSVNFYKFARNKGLFLVDLPGYGYAKIQKTEIESLNKLLESYFLNRRQLKKTYLLIDSKTGVHENDAHFLKFFGKYEIPYSIVLTKIDKTSKTELKLLSDLIIENLSTQRFFDKNLIEVSSRKNFALDALRADVYSTFFNES